MPTTGETCEKAGVYMGSCGHEHRFDKGDTFTPCTYCNKSVTWTWVRPL